MPNGGDVSLLIAPDPGTRLGPDGRSDRHSNLRRYTQTSFRLLVRNPDKPGNQVRLPEFPKD